MDQKKTQKNEEKIKEFRSKAETTFMFEYNCAKAVLKELHPDFRDKAWLLLLRLNKQLGWWFYPDEENLEAEWRGEFAFGDTIYFIKLLSGWRSFGEQRELYNKGRKTKGKIVTNAKPGQSYHNYGLAIDVGVISISMNGKVAYVQNPDIYIKAATATLGNPRDGTADKDFEEIVWGGDWNKDGIPGQMGEFDYGHFEYHVMPLKVLWRYHKYGWVRLY